MVVVLIVFALRCFRHANECVDLCVCVFVHSIKNIMTSTSTPASASTLAAVTTCSNLLSNIKRSIPSSATPPSVRTIWIGDLTKLQLLKSLWENSKAIGNFQNITWSDTTAQKAINGGYIDYYAGRRIKIDISDDNWLGDDTEYNKYSIVAADRVIHALRAMISTASRVMISTNIDDISTTVNNDDHDNTVSSSDALASNLTKDVSIIENCLRDTLSDFRQMMKTMNEIEDECNPSRAFIQPAKLSSSAHARLAELTKLRGTRSIKAALLTCRNDPIVKQVILAAGGCVAARMFLIGAGDHRKAAILLTHAIDAIGDESDMSDDWSVDNHHVLSSMMGCVCHCIGELCHRCDQSPDQSHDKSPESTTRYERADHWVRRAFAIRLKCQDADIGDTVHLLLTIAQARGKPHEIKHWKRIFDLGESERKRIDDVSLSSTTTKRSLSSSLRTIIVAQEAAASATSSDTRTSSSFPMSSDNDNIPSSQLRTTSVSPLLPSALSVAPSPSASSVSLLTTTTTTTTSSSIVEYLIELTSEFRRTMHTLEKIEAECNPRRKSVVSEPMSKTSEYRLCADSANLLRLINATLTTCRDDVTAIEVILSVQHCFDARLTMMNGNNGQACKTVTEIIGDVSKWNTTDYDKRILPCIGWVYNCIGHLSYRCDQSWKTMLKYEVAEHWCNRAFSMLSECHDPDIGATVQLLLSIAQSQKDPKKITHWKGILDLNRLVSLSCVSSSPILSPTPSSSPTLLMIDGLIDALSEFRRIMDTIDQIEAECTPPGKLILPSKLSLSAQLRLKEITKLHCFVSIEDRLTKCHGDVLATGLIMSVNHCILAKILIMTGDNKKGLQLLHQAICVIGSWKSDCDWYGYKPILSSVGWLYHCIGQLCYRCDRSKTSAIRYERVDHWLRRAFDTRLKYDDPDILVTVRLLLTVAQAQKNDGQIEHWQRILDVHNKPQKAPDADSLPLSPRSGMAKYGPQINEFLINPAERFLFDTSGNIRKASDPRKIIEPAKMSSPSSSPSSSSSSSSPSSSSGVEMLVDNMTILKGIMDNIIEKEAKCNTASALIQHDNPSISAAVRSRKDTKLRGELGFVAPVIKRPDNSAGRLIASASHCITSRTCMVNDNNIKARKALNNAIETMEKWKTVGDWYGDKRILSFVSWIYHCIGELCYGFDQPPYQRAEHWSRLAFDIRLECNDPDIGATVQLLLSLTMEQSQTNPQEIEHWKQILDRSTSEKKREAGALSTTTVPMISSSSVSSSLSATTVSLSSLPTQSTSTSSSTSTLSLSSLTGQLLSTKECDMNFELARKYWSRGDATNRRRAFECYSKAAHSGHVKSMVSLGDFYDKGINEVMERHLDTAIEWYQKAVVHESVDAMYGLSRVFMRSETPKMFMSGLKLMKRAADLGHPTPCHDFGWLIYNHFVHKRSIGKLTDIRQCKSAVHYLERSISIRNAEQNMTRTDIVPMFEEYMLADIYNYGYNNTVGDVIPCDSIDSAVSSATSGNMKKISDLALLLYQRSAAAGNRSAQLMVGLVYYHGTLGVKADPETAVVWFRKSLDAGCVHASFPLASCYMKGFGRTNKKETQRSLNTAALRLLYSAVENQDRISTFHLGQFFYYGQCGYQKNHSVALGFFCLLLKVTKNSNVGLIENVDSIVSAEMSVHGIVRKRDANVAEALRLMGNIVYQQSSVGQAFWYWRQSACFGGTVALYSIAEHWFTQRFKSIDYGKKACELWSQLPDFNSSKLMLRRTLAWMEKVNDSSIKKQEPSISGAVVGASGVIADVIAIAERPKTEYKCYFDNCKSKSSFTSLDQLCGMYPVMVKTGEGHCGVFCPGMRYYKTVLNAHNEHVDSTDDDTDVNLPVATNCNDIGVPSLISSLKHHVLSSSCSTVNGYITTTPNTAYIDTASLISTCRTLQTSFKKTQVKEKSELDTTVETKVDDDTTGVFLPDFLSDIPGMYNAIDDVEETFIYDLLTALNDDCFKLNDLRMLEISNVFYKDVVGASVKSSLMEVNKGGYGTTSTTESATTTGPIMSAHDYIKSEEHDMLQAARKLKAKLAFKRILGRDMEKQPIAIYSLPLNHDDCDCHDENDNDDDDHDNPSGDEVIDDDDDTWMDEIDNESKKPKLVPKKKKKKPRKLDQKQRNKDKGKSTDRKTVSDSIATAENTGNSSASVNVSRSNDEIALGASSSSSFKTVDISITRDVAGRSVGINDHEVITDVKDSKEWISVASTRRLRGYCHIRRTRGHGRTSFTRPTQTPQITSHSTSSTSSTLRSNVRRNNDKMSRLIPPQPVHSATTAETRSQQPVLPVAYATPIVATPTTTTPTPTHVTNPIPMPGPWIITKSIGDSLLPLATAKTIGTSTSITTHTLVVESKASAGITKLLAPTKPSNSRSSSSSTPSHSSDSPSNSTTPSINSTSTDCVVCLSEPKTVVILPCKHLCVCQQCHKQLSITTKICPVCRSSIMGHIIVYT